MHIQDDKLKQLKTTSHTLHEFLIFLNGLKSPLVRSSPTLHESTTKS